VVGLLSQLLTNPPAGYQPAPTAGVTSAKAAAPGRNLDWHEMLRTPQFYQLWFMFILAAAAGLMIIAHAAIIAKEQAGLKWGFMPIVLLAIFNTAGRITSGFLSDRIGRTRTMILAFLLQAVNMFLFAQYTTPHCCCSAPHLPACVMGRSSRSCRPPLRTSTACATSG